MGEKEIQRYDAIRGLQLATASGAWCSSHSNSTEDNYGG
jgi:hypothetical protein